jgi:hypothetical protein
LDNGSGAILMLQLKPKLNRQMAAAINYENRLVEKNQFVELRRRNPNLGCDRSG